MQFPQAFHEGINGEELNKLLFDGAHVICLERVPRDDYTREPVFNVVLETRVAEPDLDAAGIIASFLASVNPKVLEDEMLKAPDTSMGPGELAIRYLVGLVRERVSGA